MGVQRRSGRAAVLVIVACSALAWTSASVDANTAPVVRVRVLRFVDHSRVARFRDGTSGPRVLVTYVRYPARGHPPFPLVVFGHGFALTPQVYGRLLDTWARAGYVVAAPVFPVENANAPGGADEQDLGNQPRDMSFVTTRLIAPSSPLRTLVDRTKIAFAGQSDGAETALSAVYDGRFRDPRVDAAVILSGAALPGFTAPPAGSPPLLAVQGTRDPVNAPSTTLAYYRVMRRPKFLLWLIGATHLPPYTTDDRWASVVGRATTAFFDHYLRGAPLDRLMRAGTQTGVARITSGP